MKKFVSDFSEQIRGVSYTNIDLHEHLNENSIILLRANNISYGELNFDSVVYVDRSRVSEKQILRKGDIVVCTSSGSKHLVGKAAQVDFDDEVTFGAFLKVVRPKNINAEFLGIYFLSDIYRRSISAVSEGANINNIRNEHIDNLQITVPIEKKQIEITKMISNVLNLIKLRKKELHEYDQLIKSRFVEMFGDPIYNSKLLPVIELGKACDMKAGKFKKAENISNDFEENLYPCFGGNGIRGYVEDYTHEGSIPIIGRQGALCGNVQFATGKFYATEHAIVTQTKIGWNSLWLYIMLHEMDLNRFASGAAQPGLNVSTLVTLEVINPEVELQNEYAEFVQSAYKLKFKIQKSLEESQMLFNSLMQEYFE